MWIMLIIFNMENSATTDANTKHGLRKTFATHNWLVVKLSTYIQPLFERFWQTSDSLWLSWSLSCFDPSSCSSWRRLERWKAQRQPSSSSRPALFQFCSSRPQSESSRVELNWIELNCTVAINQAASTSGKLAKRCWCWENELWQANARNYWLAKRR